MLNLFDRKDATLREILTTLRSTAPQTAEYRHPLARYSFRSIYFDSHASSSRREGGKMGGGGHFASKDLGIVYSRDILGDPGSISSGVAPRLLEDYEADTALTSGEGAGNKTLEELKFVPGDFLCVAVLLPKNVAVTSGISGELAVKSGPGSAAAATAPSNGWKTSGPRGGDGGWGGPVSAFGGGGGGRGSGGHWRGESNGPSGLGRGRGGTRRDRDDDFRRVPPPRRDSSPPRRSGRGAGGGGGRRRSRSSRSRSPLRRNPRYD
jgi:histone deacetylase complex subunit SAP18